MDTVECPYCKHKNNVNDGPYGDDEEGEEYCYECGDMFIVIAQVSITYDVRCRPDAHDMKPWGYEPDWDRCTRCGYINTKPERERHDDSHPTAAS